MSKPYSKRTKRALKHTRKQTENVRDLSKDLESTAKEGEEITKEMDADAKQKPWPKDYWMPGGIARRKGFLDQWNENYDRWDELKTTTEEAPFNMTALMKAAVREHGMPKKKKSRGAIFSREQAAKLQKKIKKRK
tara:strand:- start:5205 stop:5609 length:405 start_codon:yes stop_codon:yes gene_type:complete